MTIAKKIALIGGDGIGPEVLEWAVRVLEKAASGYIDFDFRPLRLGAERFLETGEVLPEEDLAQIIETDAILFGAVGGDPRDSRLKRANIERELLLKLRFRLDQAVNLRPTLSYRGLWGPLRRGEDLDFVVVREGTEGPYAGQGGRFRPDSDQEIATEVSINTDYGIRRVVRFAFELAQKRRQNLVLVHKTNVLVHAGSLWLRIFDETSRDYPQVQTRYLHVDSATMWLVERPQSLDVLVTDNLFGDILTDLAGSISGGIGLAASANLNLSGRYPSMFEPVHGSAPDIAGQGRADPRAAILSAGLLLDHLGFERLGERIRQAVRVDVEGDNPPNRSTGQVGLGVLDLI